MNRSTYVIIIFMNSLELKQIAACTRGDAGEVELRGSVTGVSIDSKKVKKGDLFIAVKGEKYDGHNFVTEALKICSAALVEKNISASVSKPLIRVNSTKTALQEIAAFWRTKINPRVVAVTGSNGKTTTKDMLEHILKKSLRVVAAEKSFNNFIGVPLTVLEAGRKTEVLITEMETNVIGGIRTLCMISQPHIGIITNVSDTHLADLKTKENVFREKNELAAGLADGGTLIINADDKYAKKFQPRKGAAKLTYSIKNESDFRAEMLEENLSGSVFKIKGAIFKLKIPGRFNVLNAAAASCAAMSLGIPLDVSAKRIFSFKPQSGRMEIKKIGGSILINDSFNANPGSSKSLCGVISREKGAKILVFADMLELGDAAEALHTLTGERFARAGVQKIFYTGKYGHLFISGAKKVNAKITAKIYEDKKTMFEDIKKEADGIFIFKGSRKMNIDEVYENVVQYLSSRNR